MKLPIDGLTPEEKELLEVMFGKPYVVDFPGEIYQLFNDPIDKFVIAFLYEMKRTQQDTASALGLKHPSISRRLPRIKRTIKGYMVSKRMMNN